MVRIATKLGWAAILVFFSLTICAVPCLTQEGETEKSDPEPDEVRIEREIAGLPDGWFHLSSRGGNFVVFSDAERGMATQIARQLEGARTLFTKLFPGEARLAGKTVVRLFREKEEYIRNGAPEGSLGCWSDETMDLSFHCDPKLGRGSLYMALKHEAFHQFIRCYAGCRPAPWFDEGSADYFAAGEFLGERLKVRENAWCRDKIRAIILRKEFVPLKEFFALTPEEYRVKKELCHPQGWSIIHFLRQGKRKGARMQRKWEKIPDLYLQNLAAACRDLEKRRGEKAPSPGKLDAGLSRKASLIALEHTFAGWSDDDWAALEKAWLDFSR